MKKAIIIGAGPAGLTAGIELLRSSKEYEVTILESRDIIGGIACTVNHNGNYMDMGGHRFFSKNDAVNKWWQQILPRGNAKNSDKVFMSRKRISRIYSNGKFFDYPLKLSFSVLRDMGLKNSLSAGAYYVSARLYRRPDSNLENFYINRFGKKLYSMFFKNYTEKVWGTNPENISSDWGTQRVKGLSIAMLLKSILLKKSDETSLIEQFDYPKFGPGQMWNEAAARFCELDGKIIRNARVTAVCPSSDGSCTVTYINTAQNSTGSATEAVTLPADVLISSMPLSEFVLSLPDAPEKYRDIAKNLPYRDFLTVGLLVDKKYAMESLSDCWIYVQDSGVRLGRIQIFNNWSPYMVQDSKNTLWLGLEYFCNENDEMWNMSESDLARLGKSELKKIGILKPSAKILDFHEEKVKKAYPAYWSSYNQLPELIRYIDEFSGIYCIGRNGQHRYNNMDHSMLTAFAAVSAILGNEKKSQIWNINAEKDYLEENRT